MRTRLPIRIFPQPDEITCGPTCLHAIYHILCVCPEQGEWIHV